jgi:hypothetical protein
MTTTIFWKPGSVHKIPAEDCYLELERVRAECDGDLSAADVVEAARPEGSVLHPQVFDKAPGEAAEQYYLARARSTMRSIVVEYTAPERKDPITVRALSTVARVKVGSRSVQVYSSTEEALHDPERRKYLLSEAKRQLKVWRQQNAELTELAKIFKVIDETVD